MQNSKLKIFNNPLKCRFATTINPYTYVTGPPPISTYGGAGDSLSIKKRLLLGLSPTFPAEDRNPTLPLPFI